MTYPLDKLLAYLKTVDEVQILELLDLSTEDILTRFHDRVSSRRQYLEKELEVLYEEDVEGLMEEWDGEREDWE
jgi:predicted ribonuclease toxin of YeeF-YezG toxin-antitoxin module